MLTERLGDDLRDLWTDEDTVEYQVDGARAHDVLRTLRDDDDLAYFMLADAAAVDYGPGERFEVVYHLFSCDSMPAGCASAPTSIAPTRASPTITDLWEGAMFHEREMYDMMGIVFEGNRDLRRIYMSPDYRSFPQRRDFVLPDDAADSPAAGVNPLERPETWDLTRFRDAPGVTFAAGPPSDPSAPGEAVTRRRDPLEQEPAAMTSIDPETRIPDPIDLDRIEEARLRAVAEPRPDPDERGASTPASTWSASRIDRRRPNGSARSTPSTRARCS